MTNITNNSYSIHTDGDITSIELTSEVNPQLIMRVLDDLANLESCPKRLWDLRSIDFNWNTKDLQNAADYALKVFGQKNYKAAFVTEDMLVYGEIRQFQALSNDFEGVKISVFNNKAEAIKWLDE